MTEDFSGLHIGSSWKGTVEASNVPLVPYGETLILYSAVLDRGIFELITVTAMVPQNITIGPERLPTVSYSSFLAVRKFPGRERMFTPVGHDALYDSLAKLGMYIVSRDSADEFGPQGFSSYARVSWDVEKHRDGLWYEADNLDIYFHRRNPFMPDGLEAIVGLNATHILEIADSRTRGFRDRTELFKHGQIFAEMLKRTMDCIIPATFQ